MAKLIDLTSKVFGRLTVLERDRNRKGTYWKCRCECGNVKTIKASSLTRKHPTRSCGCLKRETTSRVRLIDLTGKVFGRLIVLGREGSSRSGQPLWRCRCKCGNECVVFGGALRDGRTQSCGCLQRERVSETSTTHGQTHSIEYNTWANMKQRCLNPNASFFSNYGGRGIRVCDRWLHSFENFLADVGPRPSNGHSIDRIDNNGDYEPGNVRWALSSVQQKNTRPYRKALRITANEETHTISEWAEITGIRRNTIYMRLTAYGWSPLRALGLE